MNRSLLMAVGVALLGLPSCKLIFGPPRPPQYERVVRDAELVIQDLIVPEEGPRVAPGDEVTLHYCGWLLSGAEFDSSFDRGLPITFEVGSPMSPEGLHHGVVGMRAGGRRCIVVPPGLGYGEAGAGGSIPPGATLIFDIEVVSLAREASSEP